MKSLLSLLFFAFIITVQSQENISTNDNPIEKLSFLIGTWKGEGWMMTQAGKQTSKITEVAACKADCSVIAVEGLGVKTDPETQEETVVHDAFGVIYIDPETNALAMRAYKDGRANESPIEFIEDKIIRWFIDIPNGSKVRFTSDYSTENKWVEIGEFSRDGENWMQFLGMELTKVEN
ncbi:hypothetical protein RXV94_04140 [Yeosuana sp. MJ-SS3]|jgi:hypothetical protein|uniref:DUF1579 domain-containing protein n=1 Tax=Gilvirhabdus luticola TaxID=3079858 RepID=A0ABU3U4K4_9FLAO|nr:hypothetical protein [Yeosuana sp. MJ-SS3]MDU8885339.1 hypothetical protein [Yeosuana sp. MJ-SS3]